MFIGKLAHCEFYQYESMNRLVANCDQVIVTAFVIAIVSKKNRYKFNLQTASWY